MHDLIGLPPANCSWMVLLLGSKSLRPTPMAVQEVVILRWMASFYIENFGCRAARADGEAVSTRLLADGMNSSGLAGASVVILNTCSVTAEADRDARAFLRKTRKLNPKAKVVVMGCYAQRVPEEIAALEGVTAVVGNSHKGLAPQIVRTLASGPGPTLAHDAAIPQLISAAALGARPGVGLGAGNAQIWVDDRFAHSYIEDAQVVPGLQPGSQTRPNLKIQEGCGNRCTFCVIPATRGSSRSLTAAKVMAQVRGFVAAGGKELVLSGINLGRWGRDLPENSAFAVLIRTILEESDLPRLRLSSIEPMDWTPELIGLMGEFACGLQRGRSRGSLARHAHLPLQSGSDAVLRRMHRRYRPWHYQQKIADLRQAVGPELAIGADVMAGFPGETDGEFRETYDFIANLPFAYLHLFPFSPRPGTRGWELHRQTPVLPQAVAERMAALHALASEKSQAFRASFLGCTLPAITLHTPIQFPGQQRTSALTDNFLPVELPVTLPANQLVNTHLTGRNAAGVLLGKTDSTDRNITVAI